MLPADVPSPHTYYNTICLNITHPAARDKAPAAAPTDKVGPPKGENIAVQKENTVIATPPTRIREN